jgi:hypothetical protein
LARRLCSFAAGRFLPNGCFHAVCSLRLIPARPFKTRSLTRPGGAWIRRDQFSASCPQAARWKPRPAG